jgi:diketogulonate reductase-like aldo/keto reductase
MTKSIKRIDFKSRDTLYWLGHLPLHRSSRTNTNHYKEAVKLGYRHFDCAYIYSNEDVIGKTLQKCYDNSNGTLKREDFFITSKCWITFLDKDRVQLCLDKTLEKSGFKYIDLVDLLLKLNFNK